jgi:folate-dependent tRNA-U54 methylase TrmFO/GidA
VTGYEFPQLTTGDDANWVTADVDLALDRGSSYSARVSLTLRTEELTGFRDELRSLDADLTGVAKLTHLEEEIGLRLQLKRGKGVLSGFVLDHVGPELRFDHIEVDQTFVREALDQIDALVEAFPVRGNPFG